MFETLLAPFNWISRFFVPKSVELSASAERCNTASQADTLAPSVKSFHYKRFNRIQEILSTLQSKENTDIPKEILHAIKQEIEKDGRVPTSVDIVKYYLKRLSLQHYYEHAPFIFNKLNNVEFTRIPKDVEEKFCEMFKQIQEPFEIVKAQVSPSTSFLSYNYVLYKFCELSELDEYKKHFSLLNNVEKLRVQDKMWKGICEILNWKYISTIDREYDECTEMF